MNEQNKTLVHPVKRIRTDIVKRLDSTTNISTQDSDYSEQYFTPQRPVRKINPSNHRFINWAAGCEIITAPDQYHWVTEMMAGEELRPGEFIIIEAGTGTGKNTYIEAVSNYITEKMAILTNRKANRDQIDTRIPGKLDSFDLSHVYLASYQSLEMNASIQSEDLEKFGIIVCDEFHYWSIDGRFNNRVEVSLDKVINTKHPIKIFLSATPGDMVSEIIRRIRNNPEIKVDPAFLVKHFVLNKSCFNFNAVSSADWDYVLKKINDSNERWLCFVDSKDTGNKLKEKLGDDAIFVDSESSLKKGRAAGELKYIIEHEAFRPKVLISTSVLDNGINLKMPDLTHIVIDCNNKSQIIQMAGRKRPVSKDDTAELILIEQSENKLRERLRATDTDISGYVDFRNELATFGWPNTRFSQNSKESNLYRNRMCWDDQNHVFGFNQLGFNQAKHQKLQLQELLDTSSQLATKCNWIFGCDSPPVAITFADIVASRNYALNNVLAKFANHEMQIKSEDALNFRDEFATVYYEINGCDRSKGQRKSNGLSIAQIREIIRSHGLNYEITSLERIQKRKRKRFILIKSNNI